MTNTPATHDLLHEQWAHICQSAKEGNPDHQFMLYLVEQVENLWNQVSRAALADAKTQERLSALEAQQPPSASKPPPKAESSEIRLCSLMHKAWKDAFQASSVYDPKVIGGMLMLVVADWLDQRGNHGAADELRQEADR